MKKKTLISLMLFSMTTLMLVLIYIYIKPILFTNAAIANTNVRNSEQNVDIQEVELPTVNITEIEYIDITSKLLPVKFLSQLPELPTGCEITSLTTVLNYLGYDVEKEYMAKYYLDKSSDFTGTFHEYYIGDPFTDEGWGCFSTVITKSANLYLSRRHSKYVAHNISGSSLEDLFEEINEGRPVVVWASSSMYEPSETYIIAINDGRTAEWYSNEHCLVLIGYDLDRDIVVLSDPLQGIVNVPINVFNARYIEFQKQAVVIY